MNALYILVSTICFHTINAPIYQQVPGKSSIILGDNVCVEAVVQKSTMPIVAHGGETVYGISMTETIDGNIITLQGPGGGCGSTLGFTTAPISEPLMCGGCQKKFDALEKRVEKLEKEPHIIVLPGKRYDCPFCVENKINPANGENK